MEPVIRLRLHELPRVLQRGFFTIFFREVLGFFLLQRLLILLAILRGLLAAEKRLLVLV